MGSNRKYLKFGNIKGEVTEPAYRSWIELKSVSWGGRPASVGSGGGSPQNPEELRDISCIKDRDSTTPQLFQYCADGRIADAVIDIVRESGGVEFRLEMPGALISSVKSGDGGMDDISINCKKINFKQEPGTPPP